ncbi:MAG: hypothetical protein NVSMB31_01200 [Vulcanimicrobiaceae bacterium]
MGMLYVTEPFTLTSGKNFQKGVTMDAADFEELYKPENFQHVSKVMELSDEGRARIGMRDATPNKPIHANVHPDNATVGSSGVHMRSLNRNLGGDGHTHEERKEVLDALRAPIAPNEGDTRLSHRDTLMSEHAADANWIQGAGPTRAERDEAMLGSQDAEASGSNPKIEMPKSVSGIGHGANVVFTSDNAAPDVRVAIVPDPATEPAPAVNDDRLNADGEREADLKK